MRLAECRSRRSVNDHGDRFACLHPRVRTADGLVTAAVCAICDWREELGSSDVGVSPASATDSTASHWHWAVGMTTAPRAQPTLAESLASLAAAGWNAPRLFIEPGTNVPHRFAELPASRRDRRLGAFPNWCLGLIELFLREPRAEAYLICQDDAIFSEGARQYLERTLWPAAEVGVVSLYTPSHWSSDKPRGFHRAEYGWDSWGAPAYLFTNRSLRGLLAHPLLVNHRHHGRADGLRNIDSVVGAWCQATGVAFPEMITRWRREKRGVMASS